MCSGQPRPCTARGGQCTRSKDDEGRPVPEKTGWPDSFRREAHEEVQKKETSDNFRHWASRCLTLETRRGAARVLRGLLSRRAASSLLVRWRRLAKGGAERSHPSSAGRRPTKRKPARHERSQGGLPIADTEPAPQSDMASSSCTVVWPRAPRKLKILHCCGSPVSDHFLRTSLQHCHETVGEVGGMSSNRAPHEIKVHKHSSMHRSRTRAGCIGAGLRRRGKVSR